MKRKLGLDPQAVLDTTVETVKDGLELIPTDQANFIIGRTGYGSDAVLSRAVAAQHQLLFAVLREDFADAKLLEQTLAKTQAVMLQLVHVAYAAGIRRGRGDKRKGGRRRK